MKQHGEEIRDGERFQFGKNWARFLSVLDDERIAEAERSLSGMLRVDGLDGVSFLDIGCGSGLFSLAARRMGAVVHSMDFDPQSVACARELKRRFYRDDESWELTEGSVLDRKWLESLGRYDVVYSWGVLHHTGRMWDALENAALPVRAGGKLFISIYNDQGWRSNFYKKVKRFYCSGLLQRALVVCAFVPAHVVYGFFYDVFSANNPLRRYTDYKKKRGMSYLTDQLDWLGGYPFEVAKPEQIIDFYAARNFRLLESKTTKSNGTNQFVFQKQGQ
jgi:2-polyprenyl-6-hydroxyphenyl methylase/3-demethylubiquinone-9 3-methyltransferase